MEGKNYDSGCSKSAECDVDMFLFTTMSLLFIILGLCSLLLVIGASPVVFLVRELLAAMPNHNSDNNRFAKVEVWLALLNLTPAMYWDYPVT